MATRLRHLPNVITVARIALVPLFVVLAYGGTRSSAVLAFIVFFVASVSDLLDGYLARRQGTVSRAGEWLDPLADKLLVGAALWVLVDTRAFPLWAALLIALREVAVQILRARIVNAGGRLPASPAAKAKTVLQIAMVSVWLLPIGVGPVHWILLGAGLIATYWSGAAYFTRARSPLSSVP
ncbi:MAG TPA: CDP-diacylglycerol--glycerol-3-phosphate 3-phosphatidyltransferase [Actinomycetota bacterium]|nr:CDP-diacylglycerol--glycerol-3-phosphate 3-phosphatidyltransferase [Actinomycetota bacterium]